MRGTSITTRLPESIMVFFMRRPGVASGRRRCGWSRKPVEPDTILNKFSDGESNPVSVIRPIAAIGSDREHRSSVRPRVQCHASSDRRRR